VKRITPALLSVRDLGEAGVAAEPPREGTVTP
jgi:hypothetical protein